MNALPWITLEHLDRMTDATGLIQHAIYSIPRRESGYTTDDNSRALRLCARLWCQHPEGRMLDRITLYFSFLEYARCPGGFHNFMNYEKQWQDARGCGDCQGQALRALAEILASPLPDAYRTLARELLDTALPTAADLRSLRAQAYVILAWGHLWAAGVAGLEPFEAVAWFAAQRLMESYQLAARPDWQWFEPRMTYANAVLPHALLVAARRWPQEAFLQVAEAAFAFLDDATTHEDCFWPVGNQGWYLHGENKAPYDQQPVEAATMAEAAQFAFNFLGVERHRETYRRAHGWFHGYNSLHLPLVDPSRGACYDGLQVSGVNRNQGAESTLAYLWVELIHREFQRASGEHRQVAASA